MAIVNLKSTVIENINIKSQGGSNPTTTVLSCPADEVLVVEAIWAVCIDVIQDSYIFARVARTAGSTFDANIAYNQRLRRNYPAVNLLLGRSLYLAENESLVLTTGSPSGDWSYVFSYARIDNTP